MPQSSIFFFSSLIQHLSEMFDSFSLGPSRLPSPNPLLHLSSILAAALKSIGHLAFIDLGQSERWPSIPEPPVHTSRCDIPLPARGLTKVFVANACILIVPVPGVVTYVPDLGLIDRRNPMREADTSIVSLYNPS